MLWLPLTRFIKNAPGKVFFSIRLWLPRDKNNCNGKRVAQFISQTKVWGFLAYKMLINFYLEAIVVILTVEPGTKEIAVCQKIKLPIMINQ